MPVDTWRDHICFLHRDCTVYPAPDYLGPNKVFIACGSAEIRVRVNVLDDDQVIGRDEIGLSQYAFDTLGLPEGTEVTLERATPPDSLSILRGKVAGSELGMDQMRDVIRDIVDYRYTEREIVAFLVAASKELTLSEIQALTRARAEYAHHFTWSREVIVDKHSMGGVPGSRISMIVIPIVAAHGLWIPKTSSRAITSAAGTADAMECIAEVDLAPEALHDVVEAVEAMVPVPGRMQVIDGGPKWPRVVVDYAHTPDAVEKALAALRPQCRGDLICVVGCGGDRDRGKRAQMAHAAVKGSDRVWFTSDNPRGEDPEQILHDMGRGIDASNTQRVRSEVDRAEAIAAALTSAEPDDVVLIAGKGHEQTQEINGEFIPFSDFAVVHDIQSENS